MRTFCRKFPTISLIAAGMAWFGFLGLLTAVISVALNPQPSAWETLNFSLFVLVTYGLFFGLCSGAGARVGLLMRDPEQGLITPYWAASIGAVIASFVVVLLSGLTASPERVGWWLPIGVIALNLVLYIPLVRFIYPPDRVRKKKKVAA